MLKHDEKEKILSMHSKISIYSPWTDPILFKRIIDELSAPFLDLKIDKVVGIEARGLIMGGAVAYKIGAGFVLCRKKGNTFQYKYPRNLVFSKSSIDYSGKRKTLELEKGNKGVAKGDKVLIIDDWFGSGNQGLTAIDLVHRAGGIVVGFGIMLDDMSKETRLKYSQYNFHSLITRTPSRG